MASPFLFLIITAYYRTTGLIAMLLSQALTLGLGMFTLIQSSLTWPFRCYRKRDYFKGTTVNGNSREGKTSLFLAFVMETGLFCRIWKEAEYLKFVLGILNKKIYVLKVSAYVNNFINLRDERGESAISFRVCVKLWGFLYKFLDPRHQKLPPSG